MRGERVLLLYRNARYEHVAQSLVSLGLIVEVVEKPTDLKIELIRAFNPRWIFVLHWSWLIPREIVTEFRCVVFHMTDLPFGRGGSPLQNLIVRGIRETKISALLCTEDLDAGPIFLKAALNLDGTAAEIFDRASLLIKDMIIELLNDDKKPEPQTGQVTYFSRMKPTDSNLHDIESLSMLYDRVRMVDAADYPKAHIYYENLRIEFFNAELEEGAMRAQVLISLKKS